MLQSGGFCGKQRAQCCVNVGSRPARGNFRAHRVIINASLVLRLLTRVSARRPCPLLPWRTHVKLCARRKHCDTHQSCRVAQVGFWLRDRHARNAARRLTWVNATSRGSAQLDGVTRARAGFRGSEPYFASHSASPSDTAVERASELYLSTPHEISGQRIQTAHIYLQHSHTDLCRGPCPCWAWLRGIRS